MSDNDVRTCNDCGESKPITEFVLHVKKGYRKGHCRSCAAVRSRNWRHADPDRAYGQHLLRRYGITFDDYLAIAAAQGGGCAICGKLPTMPGHATKNPDAPPRLCVDHCHTTGRIRGLLCDPCNKALGLFEDDPARTRLAAAYLEREGR